MLILGMLNAKKSSYRNSLLMSRMIGSLLSQLYRLNLFISSRFFPVLLGEKATIQKQFDRPTHRYFC